MEQTAQLYEDTAEDLLWQEINPDHIWILDKLILSKKLGYICGPVGIDVPKPGWYIVRPCVNAMGLGLGAQKIWLTKDTTFLPVGHFWCEWFEGDHHSVDFWPRFGAKVFTIQGIKYSDLDLVKWQKWIKVDHKDEQVVPKFLFPYILDYHQINLEYVNDKLIEVHLRPNEDFGQGRASSEFIPVWEDQKTTPPKGYIYIEYPDCNGRIGAFIK